MFLRAFPPAKTSKEILYLFRIAFAAGAVRLSARATNLDVFKCAVATCVIVLASAYVASYIVINLFHIIPSERYCVPKASKYARYLTKGGIWLTMLLRRNT